LETSEKLEQLRILENGTPIKVVLTDRAVPSIDRPEDLAAAEHWAAERGLFQAPSRRWK
jgi:3-deoxy-manno-octulosonate cytidylyltransferase (CMP-KDO synthetase)